ncbi:MAG: repeat-containing protein [Mucilaginibacter sp.]|nr:repeat-containing protein [Mucilaginibacter sp.]
MRKPLTGPIFLAISLLSLIIAGTGCTKTPTSVSSIAAPMVVTLNVISSLTQTTAQSGGIVTNANGGEITANGVCWSSTNQTPTTADSKTTDTVNVNGFTSRITGLTPGTTYYLRAYATNSSGPGYGAVIKFTTSTTVASLTTTVSTFAGNANYGFLDGAAASALFSGPQALAFNPVDGNIYIIDALNNSIRTMTTAGFVSTLTKNSTLGYADGTLLTALFNGPRSIAFDAQGNAYVADFGTNIIRKITTAGVVSTFAGNGTRGYADGSGSIVEFNNPRGLAVDAQGNVYVSDSGNHLIRKITPAGVVSTFVGAVAATGYSQTLAKGYYDGTGTLCAFNSPSGLAIDAQGNIYVADQGNSAIRMVTPAGVVTTLAGTPVQKNVVGSVTSLAVDAQGNLYIADESGRILEITAAKVLYTLAGSINTAGFVDGPGSTALFSTPMGVTVDTKGNVYVGDFNNNCIRKIVVKFQ